MQQCSNCGHQNRAGIFHCENCGFSLLGEKPLDTKSIGASTEEEKAEMGVDSSVLTDVRVQGTSAFGEDDILRLEVDGSPDPIVLTPKSETILGRRDPATGAMPDVDTTPFGGYRTGVSRRHAAIRRGEGQSLNVWDLGSSNRTFLNGQELNAHRPYRLHDGDELRLGQMKIRVHFQVTAKAAESLPAAEGEKAAKAAPEAAQAEAGVPAADQAEKRAEKVETPAPPAEQAGEAIPAEQAEAQEPAAPAVEAAAEVSPAVKQAQAPESSQPAPAEAPAKPVEKKEEVTPAEAPDQKKEEKPAPAEAPVQDQAETPIAEQILKVDEEPPPDKEKRD